MPSETDVSFVRSAVASQSAGRFVFESPEFEAYATAIMTRNGVRLAVFFAVAALCWWPLDGLLFAGMPGLRDAYMVMRIGIVLVNVAVVLVLWRFGAPRRHLGVTTLAVMCGQLLFATTVIGSASGVRVQEPMYFYLAPFLSIVIIWPFAKRVIAATALSAVTVLGFMWGDSQALQQNGLLGYVTFIAFCAAFAVGIGHLVYGVIRSEFYVRSRLNRRDRQLSELAESLEERVRAQTTELRRLNAHMQDTVEAERARISSELHDELGQQLTAMRLAVDFGRRSGNLDGAQTAMADMNGLLDRTHQTIRRILRGLHPQVLQQLGLVDALRWLADETKIRAGVACSVAVSSDGSAIPEPIATSLFRCAQEALTNVGRHASAAQVSVTLDSNDARCVLTVTDDGVGIPHSTAAGFGMSGIKERARRWGGSATWSNAPGGGTALRITVPLVVQPEEGGS